jgi:hypothetical protein
MKASELRLGNLVMDGKDIEQVNARMIDMLVKIEADFDPIPLTEEWLLKFGFDKVGIALTSIAIAPLNLPCTFNLPNTPFSFCQGKLILTTGTGDFCVNIEYVHQLQNLYFALTGEELKQQEPNISEWDGPYAF